MFKDFNNNLGYIIFTGILTASFLTLAGYFYWIYLAYEMGNALMFIAAFFPLTALPVALCGAWTIFFGLPAWVAVWMPF